MKTLSIAVISVWFGVSNLSFAEFRSWTNTGGTKIDAEFVKSEGGNVTLRLRNGKTSTFSETKLSDGDREYLKTAAAAPSAAPAAPEAKPAAVAANRKAKWLSKMDKAKKESTETGLPILVLFTGTSWCPYCIKLEDEVFSKKDFKEFADKELVLLKLDFGPGGAPDSRADGELAKEFGVKGYPKYFLTDATGKQLANGGYNDGIDPGKFATWVTNAKPKN